MIECCRRPAHRIVASGAVRRRERRPCRRVYRIVGLLPRRQMAAGISAIDRRNRQRIIIVDVARGAGDVGVTVGQWKPGRVVVKRRRQPARRGVAGRAVGQGERGSSGRVNGVGGLLPGRQVASGVTAIGGRDRQIVVVIDVAGGARHAGMAAGQQKSGRAVVEPGIEPGIKCRVARFASG